MEFVILNSKLEQIHILDEYESLIWTDRYSESGDFEIYTSVNERMLDILRSNDELYLWNSMSEHVMIMDEYSIKSDYDMGSKILITGTSVEQILDRRIVWDRTTFNGSLQEGIKKLLIENAIQPVNPNRAIPNLKFAETSDTKILGMTCNYDFSGDNLYECIKILCNNNHIGFKMSLNDDDVFVMKLYSGEDRSYGQFVNPYVIFSPEFENLGSSDYINSKKNYKNVIAIPQTTDSNSQLSPSHDEYNPNNINGLNRREVLAESRSNDGSYTEDMGKKDLSKYKHNIAVEGNIDASNMYVYGKDFTIGDIVQIRNEYGFESRSRVTELIMNQSQDKLEIYPTFTSIDKES